MLLFISFNILSSDEVPLVCNDVSYDGNLVLFLDAIKCICFSYKAAQPFVGFSKFSKKFMLKSRRNFKPETIQ